MVRDPKNIKDTLIRTKMSERGGDPSKHKKECLNVVPPVCSDWKTIRAKATSEVVNINTNVSCKDSNIMYLINCGHCGEW